MNTIFRNRRSSIFALAGAILLSQNALAQSPNAEPITVKQAQSAHPLNVIMIIADDLNNRLGTYGAPVFTPNIDRLADQGVRFDRAYVQFPWCAPSRASFLTGLRPNSTRVMDLRTHIRTTVPDIKTMPQYFKEHGYFSGRVGKVFHQGVPGGIGRPGADDASSWDTVIDPAGRDKDLESTGKIVNLTPGIGLGSAMAYYADDGQDEDHTDGKVATETINMIRANKGRPFFIAAGFYRPHHPEIAPQKYFDLYPLNKVRIANETPATLARVPDVAKAWQPNNLGMSQQQQREMIRSYHASISFVDAQVGRILNAVEEMGLQDDTIVVFMSDHGYLLGEHGQWMKNSLWEEATRAPLIIKVPGARGNGESSPRTVEFVDVFPTLVQATGLPANMRNEGTSLLPLLQVPRSTAWTKPAISQVNGGRSVRTERWRYTEWEEGRKGRELYDLIRDPLSHRNLANLPRYARVISELRSLLPKGEVEARSPGIRYHPDEDCMELPADVPATVGTACKGIVADPNTTPGG